MLGRQPQVLTLLASAILLAAAPAAAQSPASNSSLKGSYWVRYLGVNDGLGDLPISFAGSVTFDGIGGYTTTGTGMTFNGTALTLTAAANGTYVVQPSGSFSMSNPFDTAGKCILFGGVAVGGVAIAASTDTPCLDTFIAIPQSTNLSTASLSGSYFVGGLEFAGGSLAASRNFLFNMNADGKGNLGNITITGSSQALADKPATQTAAGSTYTLGANGSGTLVLPAPNGVTAANQLVSGTKTLYVSQDGSFFISGSPTGFDMQIGVKALSGNVATALNGSYFTANVEYCNASMCNTPGPYSFGGSVNEVTSLQVELGHQRINGPGYTTPTDGNFDVTYSADFSPNADGTFAGFGYSLVLGAGGNYAILVGGKGDYFTTVWAKVPTYSGTGVFINPTGVVNASSSAPFTSQLAPGELISIYGTGLSNSTAAPSSLPFPTIFNNVQVKINGAAAPMTVVSATQINAIVPFNAVADNNGLVSIQVINNGVSSNIVKSFLGLTAPGVSTIPDKGLPSSNTGGIGIAAVIHQDGVNVVTTSNPAKVGEVVAVYLTGLGAVTPAVTEGTATPSTTLSKTTNIARVFIDDANGSPPKEATVAFAGLPPGLAAGANQINFTIPSGLLFIGTGYNLFTLEVDMTQTADADNIQALIPIIKQ